MKVSQECSTIRDAGISARFEQQAKDSRKRIYNLAYQLLGNASDAEDITQDALMRAWAGYKSYDKSRSFEAWLFRITMNLIVDRWRRRKSVRVCSLDTSFATFGSGETSLLVFSDSSYDPARRLLDRELSEELILAIKALTPEYRRVFSLIHAGLSYQEIADSMGCPIGTIRSRIHRTRVQLRESLAIGQNTEIGSRRGKAPVYCAPELP